MKRSEAVEQAITAGIGVCGYIGQQQMPEGDDFREFLRGKGVPYTERTVNAMGTWEGEAHELHYRREGQERYAYVLNFRYDVDSWGQSVSIFVQPVPDDQLTDTINTLRQQEKDVNQHVAERQREIDKAYPPYWRLINYNWQMSILAYHLLRQGWTPEAEKLLTQWGAYNLQEGVGLENPLVQSLLAYGQLIVAQPDPDRYIRGVLESGGAAGRHYRKLLS